MIPSTTRRSSMKRWRAAAARASTQPTYNGTTETIQNLTPPMLTMSSERSLGERWSCFVIRTSEAVPTSRHNVPRKENPACGRSLRERFEQDDASNEDVERVHVTAEGEHDEPGDERKGAAHNQQQFPRRSHRGDRVLRAVDEDREDERRRDRGGHRQPPDREREGSEIANREREDAGGEGGKPALKQERTAGLHRG